MTKLLTWKLSRGREYVTIKDSKYLKVNKDWKYLKVNNVYPLYLINNKVNGYLKKLMEINILRYFLLIKAKNKNIKNFGARSEI